MRIISINDFCQTHATIRFINSLRQYWRKHYRFSCIGRPKEQNILVYFSGCIGKVRTKSGRVLEIEENGIMYAPLGSEYEIEIYHCGDGGYTVGVNFLMFDEQREPLIFSQDILAFPPIAAACRAMDTLDSVGNGQLLYCRALLETVIYEIAQRESAPSVPPVIRPSVDYLLEHYTESPSLAQIAARSHISEVYFRRVFKSVFSMSPAAYISRLKLKKAAEYLEYGEMSVQEIAEAVGYSGAAYFSKEFKAVYGVTPLRYRKQKRIATL